MSAIDEKPPQAASGGGIRRFAPLLALFAGGAAALFLLGDYLSFESLEAHRESLLAWRDAHPVLAVLGFMAIYVAAVAFSAPGAVWLTLTGGFLFGTVFATIYVVIAATIGATLIFLAARTGFGDVLREKADGWLSRMRASCRENEVSFMLVLRLVPAVPFFIANLAPAFLGVRLSTYVWTTLLGIIPGAAVYASVGSGLGALLARGERPDLGVIFDWPVLGPLLGLALLSLIPVAVKKLRAKRPSL